jgi:hypothetical protein
MALVLPLLNGACRVAPGTKEASPRRMMGVSVLEEPSYLKRTCSSDAGGGTLRR